MAVFSFIEEYDLSGKIVVPFCAHGTGGLAASVRDITEALPDSAEVLGRLVFIEQTLLRQKRQSTSGWIISALLLQKPIQKV